MVCRSNIHNIWPKKTNITVEYSQLVVKENRHSVKNSQFVVKENQHGQIFPTSGQISPSYKHHPCHYLWREDSALQVVKDSQHYTLLTQRISKTFCRFRKSSYICPRYKHIVKPLCMTRADCNPTTYTIFRRQPVSHCQQRSKCL